MTIHFRLFNKKHHPFKNVQYHIPCDCIRNTEQILKEYGKREEEGFVYWGGTRTSSDVTITSVIVPLIETDSLFLNISHHSNISFVKELHKKQIIQIAQIHTHPSSWVGHSTTDDEGAASKYEGLISIVVPYYCKNGMSALDKCGIHRFQNGKFERLSKKYTTKHFKIQNDITSNFIDLR